jgi:hypothetical protein
MMILYECIEYQLCHILNIQYLGSFLLIVRYICLNDKTAFAIEEYVSICSEMTLESPVDQKIPKTENW